MIGKSQYIHPELREGAINQLKYGYMESIMAYLNARESIPLCEKDIEEAQAKLLLPCTEEEREKYEETIRTNKALILNHGYVMSSHLNALEKVERVIEAMKTEVVPDNQ